MIGFAQSQSNATLALNLLISGYKKTNEFKKWILQSQKNMLLSTILKASTVSWSW